MTRSFSSWMTTTLGYALLLGALPACRGGRYLRNPGSVVEAPVRVVSPAAGPASPVAPARTPEPTYEEQQRRLREDRRHRRTEALAKQPKVTAKFVAQDLREVLSAIATETGTTIVLYTGGQATVDIAFNETPIETALDLLLFPIDYVYALRGPNTYVCGPADPALPIFREITTVRTLRTNLDPEDLKALLPEKSVQPFVRTTKGTRTLTVTAPEDLADRIVDLVLDLDQPKAQIVIEVLVTSVECSAGEMLGNKHEPLKYALGFKGSGTKDPAATLTEGLSYVISASAGLVGALEFLEQEGKAVVRARPRVVAMEGQASEIQAIQEFYVPIAGNLVTNPQIEVLKTGVKLAVTAVIVGSGAIELTVEPEVADVIGIDPTNALPIISRRSMKTSVRVRDGESLVIGGLYESIMRDDRTGTPGLRSIPVLKWLASSKETSCRDTELVILMTPRVLVR